MPSTLQTLTALLGLACAAGASPAQALHDRQLPNATDHEYVIVGSGAGGGVLAARLALAGHSVLLIEAGDDQGQNPNYTIPSFNAKVTEDEAMAWNFFVRHYQDDARQALDYKTTYDTPDGGEYTGLSPPEGSKIKGTLYPRSATLGGCTAHNALIAVYPHQRDFQLIADLTGDDSWLPANIRKYFVKMEANKYVQSLTSSGHGYSGWLSIDTTPATLALEDLQLLSMLKGAISALGGFVQSVGNVASFLLSDANSNAATRDTNEAIYQIPLSTHNGARNSVREFLIDVANAKNKDGTKKYPLDIRMNCFVTKVNFDTTGATPKAIGVNYLDGQALYRADPRASRLNNAGVPGTATASREVIVAGGTYNSPQILKLSGVGPAEELQRFNIPVIKDLPGVGTNLQDHYEVVVQGKTENDFPVLKGCTWGFEAGDDPCLDKWNAGSIALDRGTYVSNGIVAAMYLRGSGAENEDWDQFAFGGPVNFRGYFPGYSVNATKEHNWWSWALLKSHPRNTAGTVELASADPLDMPIIHYNYFDTGSGDYTKDIATISDAIRLARYAFANQSVPVNEILPGPEVQTQAQIEEYIKNTAWGHHASSTCPIGADNDTMAVLDSSFRVRGVEGLRVVDASVYPRIPGTFTLLSTYLVGEKAADVILSQLE